MGSGGGSIGGVDVKFWTFVGGVTKIEQTQRRGEGGPNFGYFMRT